MIKIKCIICNKFFNTHKCFIKKNKKFCSRKCKGVHQSIYPNKGCFKKNHKYIGDRKTLFRKGHIPYNKNKKRPELSGKNHHAWKGGIKNGGIYKYIYMPNHPFCTKQRYVLKHRLVMEKHIGRYLKPEEIVHHINGKTKDNNIKNLHLFSNQSEHIKTFHNNRKRIKGKFL